MAVGVCAVPVGIGLGSVCTLGIGLTRLLCAMLVCMVLVAVRVWLGWAGPLCCPGVDGVLLCVSALDDAAPVVAAGPGSSWLCACGAAPCSDVCSSCVCPSCASCSGWSVGWLTAARVATGVGLLGWRKTPRAWAAPSHDPTYCIPTAPRMIPPRATSISRSSVFRSSGPSRSERPWSVCDCSMRFANQRSTSAIARW